MIRLVLDTNVLLDLWVFDDAAVDRLRTVLADPGCTLLASATTDAELADVLARPQFALDTARQAELLATWRARAETVERVFPAPWQCTDPKDQCFVDLAFTARSDWLLTRDKALLRLARKAVRTGLRIATPAAFAAAMAAIR